MKTNKKPTDFRVDKNARLAGGYGTFAANQDATNLLRRSVMACLLWEDLAYEDGISVAHNIANLIPLVNPQDVYDIAVEARTKQKLRHTPLFIAREMARLDTHKHLVGELLPNIILRADELAEFLAIYWKDGKQPLSKQVKIGLANAFHNFSEYNLSKYNRKHEIKLRDILQLCHAKPRNKQESDLWKRLLDNKLQVPDTWEVALSAGNDKKETWERLISEHKLGALAFLRNLRNMVQADVSEQTILYGFNNVKPDWLLPINFFAAYQHAPQYKDEIERLMFQMFDGKEKLGGHTVFVVDVSGSMGSHISAKSDFSRLDAAIAMAVLAKGMCENVSIYATAGSDSERRHSTQLVRKNCNGFDLGKEIRILSNSLGGGGIFTRQCLEFIKEKEDTEQNRIIVFSDSQDCDYPEKRVPKPFGKRNYIVDVSANSRGINYSGVWDAEISGWSEHFFDYILEIEKSSN